MASPNDHHYVNLTARDHHVLRAYVALPVRAPVGVIVLLQQMDRREAEPTHHHPARNRSGERPGVNAFARQMAQRFAQAGFAVVAPSTFGRGNNSAERGYLFDRDAWGLRLRRPLEPLDTEGALLDTEAGILYARHIAPHASMGLVGYCWGGLLAWQAAARFRGIRATACHYGGGMELPQERKRQPLAPVMAHWPDDNRWMRAKEVEAFVAETEAQGSQAPVQHYRYDAAYGFMQPQLREYDEAAARLAHDRTLGFLRQHLVPPATQPA